MVRSLALVALVFSAPAAFGQAASAPSGGMPPPGHGATGQPQIPPGQQQALMMAQMRLMQAEQKAMKDPVLIAEREKIRALIEGEMLKTDPSLKPTLKRFHELEAQAKVMQDQQQKTGAVDMEKAKKLMAEMGEIGPKLEKAQMEVMKKPEVQKATKVFEQKLEAKMLEVDPEVGASRKLFESMNPNRR